MKVWVGRVWTYVTGQWVGMALILVLISGYVGWQHRYDHRNLHTLAGWVTTVDPQIAKLIKQVAKQQEQIDALQKKVP